MEGDPTSRRRSGRRDRSSKARRQPDQPLDVAVEAAAPKIPTEDPKPANPYLLRRGDPGVEMPDPATADPQLFLTPDVQLEHVPGKKSFLRLRGRLGELAILGGLLPAVTLWLGAQAHLSPSLLATIVIVEEFASVATIALHRFFDDQHSRRIYTDRSPRS